MSSGKEITQAHRVSDVSESSHPWGCYSPFERCGGTRLPKWHTLLEPSHQKGSTWSTRGPLRAFTALVQGWDNLHNLTSCSQVISLKSTSLANLYNLIGDSQVTDIKATNPSRVQGPNRITNSGYKHQRIVSSWTSTSTTLCRELKSMHKMQCQEHNYLSPSLSNFT
jgi:hypothetical protein